MTGQAPAIRREEQPGVRRFRVRIRGIVQGVGFRPFVYRIARAAGVAGWVLNDTLGVLIEAEGEEDKTGRFLSSLKSEAPPLAVIESIETEEISPTGESEFSILRSIAGEEKEPVIPPDIATCKECLREIFDPQDRRYRYPFTNCTNCGPRYTIVKDTPYDRPRTSMSVFRMCELCRREYESPEDRRFHAQPNACPVCGPQLTLTDNGGSIIECDDPIHETVRLLKKGAIIAIKGLGGFHLACDATNTAAVRRLRKRKRRPFKPFAIMSQDVETICRYAHVSEFEEEILESPASPIVLLRRKDDGPVSPLVAPCMSEFGVMLPYTPLHHLIVRDNFLALVMTSGNITDEPTIASNMTAYEKLAGIADYFLVYNRDILIQNDDSIVRVIDDHPVVMRRARGYVPRPLELGEITDGVPDILAVGAEEKGTVCFIKKGRAFLSQHLGDLKNTESVLSFERTVEHLERLLKIEPQMVARDLHPAYFSTKYALARQLLTFSVQHHHAHIAACLAENGVREKVIGISFDGAGLGMDGRAWGGEFLLADLADFERAGRLKYVHLPGGDMAAREPYRMAISYLYRAFGDDAKKVACQILQDVPESKIRAVFDLIEKRVNSPLTSSMGRLFDAVASMIGQCHRNTYEGQAPAELESLVCREPAHAEFYPFAIVDENKEMVVDMSPAVHAIVQDVLAGKTAPYIACRFHNTVAAFALKICERLRDARGLNAVALSGGVFQNRYLTEKLISLLEARGFVVYRHKEVPPNDGGISLGQAVVAACRYKMRRR